MRLLWTSTCACVLLALTACSGGGGGNAPQGSEAPNPAAPPVAAPSFAVSSNALTFSAPSPAAAPPAAQVVSATVSGTLTGTLFVLIDVLNGAGVVSVSGVTVSRDSSGQATVTPAAPSALGAGTFSAVLRVRACLNDMSCATGQLPGSPQTINVTYVIGAPNPAPAPPAPPAPPPPGADASRDVVAPRVAVANVAGQLVLRGAALGGTNSVMLRANGSSTTVAASSITQVSATEVRASYPALASGSYSVVLNSGALPFTGTLVAMPAPSFASTQLSYGETPERIAALLYDAERVRLLVVGSAPTAPGNNKLFIFRGTTLTRSVVPFANLRDLSFSADGQRLLALTDTEVLELDAELFTVSRRVAAPPLASGVRLQRMAVANDGKAIITTGGQGVTAGAPAFLYDTVARVFNPAPLLMLNTSGEERAPGVVASADGSHIYITQSTSTQFPTAQPVLDYSASNGVLSGSAGIAHMPDQALAVDQSGMRLVAYATGNTPVRVRAGNFEQVGILDVNPVAVALNRAGTRAYVLDNGNMFHNYRLSTGVPSSTSFPEVAPSMIITTPASTGTSIKSAVTADVATVFMGGVRGVIVITGLP